MFGAALGCRDPGENLASAAHSGMRGTILKDHAPKGAQDVRQRRGLRPGPRWAKHIRAFVPATPPHLGSAAPHSGLFSDGAVAQQTQQDRPTGGANTTPLRSTRRMVTAQRAYGSNRLGPSLH